MTPIWFSLIYALKGPTIFNSGLTVVEFIYRFIGHYRYKLIGRGKCFARKNIDIFSRIIETPLKVIWRRMRLHRAYHFGKFTSSYSVNSWLIGFTNRFVWNIAQIKLIEYETLSCLSKKFCYEIERVFTLTHYPEIEEIAFTITFFIRSYAWVVSVLKFWYISQN